MEADQKMIERLESISARFRELEESVSSPEKMSDPKEVVRLSKEMSSIRTVVEEYARYKGIIERIKEDTEIMRSGGDKELAEAAALELAELETARDASIVKLKSALVVKNADDERRAIVEIRAGTGGEEAALFVGDMYKMYTKYAECKGWKTEQLSSHPTEIGGYKEVIFLVEGEGAYSKFKFETGVHRVQRVPVTESSGRIHTSTTTVAVLPEAEEVEVQIDPKDIKIDLFRSSGPGGQHVNVTDSAVRITHIPTGIVVSCQDERSQHKNKAKGMKILKARLLDRQKREQEERIAKDRRKQVGRGERSEKVRTYNFPQRRITDHRIGVSLYNLDKILAGDLDGLIEKLTLAQEESAVTDGV